MPNSFGPTNPGFSPTPELIDMTSHPQLHHYVVHHPEESIHRRFIADHDWVVRVLHRRYLRRRQELALLLAQARTDKSNDGVEVFYETDDDLLNACEGGQRKFDELLNDLKRRDEWIFLAEKMANMPDPHPVYMDDLRDLMGLSGKDIFPPTGDDPVIFGAMGDEPHPDTLALKETRPHDDVSNLVVRKLIKPFEWRIRRPIRRWIHVKKKDEPEDKTASISDGSITLLGDMLTCFLAPGLIAGSMSILYCIHSTKWRLAAIFFLGLTFSLFVKLLCIPRRDVMFSTTAAFCQVLSIYVGASSGSNSFRGDDQ